ncbi:hypothetical protein I545_2955 [Mycobacterium kansasii 662]|uniref:Uncharacterized protein n=2 Tax=Mycobacterium kansasii TaxID=1768 RepID=A0A1V3WM89_MYCKA|nr:hypothetical protein I547_4929 [Mycobacterium kansasii 824]EUA18853.1 hypothetical protein I545_2955 [Mycobacterium kansasii 662]OOK68094.1 hypothetical protein BZL29_6580 [Mycobacterium kansasii]OOK71997.1 hypothetical protein BZL30_5934 [Mycobacterium kansasii]
MNFLPRYFAIWVSIGVWHQPDNDAPNLQPSSSERRAFSLAAHQF